jgi:chemotaxis protein histidine kinase CheA
MNENGDETPVDITDDLNEFEAEFFGTEKAPAAEVEDEQEPDNLGEDNPPATEEEDALEVEEEEEAPAPKPKGKPSAKERINELTAKAYEAERRAAELAAEVERLKAAPKEEEPKPVELRAVLPDGAPDPDAKGEDDEPLYPLGEFDPNYIRDLTKYTVAEETKNAEEARKQEAAQKAYEAEMAQMQTEWLGRVGEFATEAPDFQEKTEALVNEFAGIDDNYGQYLATLVMSSEVGPEILYHLSNNIGEAQKLIASGPTAATLAFGRLEAKFAKEAGEPAPTARVSEAPEPPTSRSRGSGGKVAVKPDTDDLDAFERVFFK